MSKDTTQTNGNVTEAYIEAMERTGFYRNGRPTPGVIEDVIPIELISFIYEMFIHSFIQVIHGKQGSITPIIRLST